MRAEFIPGMGTQGIMGHQLFGDLFRQFGIQTAPPVYGRQFAGFANMVFVEFGQFLGQCGLFSIGLGMDGDIFSGRHGHRARDQTRDPGNQDTIMRRMGSRDAEHQA